MSNWQLARKPIPFPVRRQCDALASPHGLLFREIRNESLTQELRLRGVSWAVSEEGSHFTRDMTLPERHPRLLLLGLDQRTVAFREGTKRLVSGDRLQNLVDIPRPL